MRGIVVLVWLLVLFCAPPAQSQIVGGLPFNLQNNTTADATQVMANFNTIINGVNANAAKNGVNSDITQLGALSTPITLAQGGTNTYVATAISTGSANAQVVSAVTPSTGFSLTAGKRVTFQAGFTNNSTLQLNIAGTGLVTVYQIQASGVSVTTGGEVVANAYFDVIYNGANYVLTNSANDAKSGINSDITQLGALVTPITPAQGGTNTYVATAISTGSANSQSVAALTPSTGFSLTAGKRVTFLAGFTNTATLQLNVAGTGLITVNRVDENGVVATSGGEVVANAYFDVVYNGSSYILFNNVSTVPFGTVLDTALSAAPSGYLLLQGQAISRTAYAALFAGIGTTYGVGDGSTTFNLPDARGRYTVMVDGGTGRSNSCGTGVLGNTCGANTIATSQLPVHTPAGTVTGTPTGTISTTGTPTGTINITDPGHTHSYTASSVSNVNAGSIGAANNGTFGSTTGSNTTGVTATFTGTGLGATSTFTGTGLGATFVGASIGSGVAYYPNTLVLNKMIKY